MKAIEIIQALVYDSDYAEDGGIVNFSGAFTLRDLFGAKSHTGELQHGKYFYVYGNEGEPLYDGNSHYKPDVIVETEEAGTVCLWKIEE